MLHLQTGRLWYPTWELPEPQLPLPPPLPYPPACYRAQPLFCGCQTLAFPWKESGELTLVFQFRLVHFQAGQPVQNDLAHVVQIRDLVVDLTDLCAAHILPNAHHL